MSATTMPDEEEIYLWAILSDETGIDTAEFLFDNPEEDDGLYRLWPIHWEWYNCPETFQVDQGARSCGKSVGIQVDTFAFPFNSPGHEMLLTAPELSHLKPITDAIEQRLARSWVMTQMRPKTQSKGLSRQPHWECTFVNGTRIISRLPNKDGRGVKGQHVKKIHMDEAQDYPGPGWVEIVECLNRGVPGARFHCHGVPKGVRDNFYEITMDSNKQWIVHRPMAMNRETWSDMERQEKIRQYGGSRQSPDYKRNIYGEHGDRANPVFVLSRFVKCLDQEAGSRYNIDIYQRCVIEFEAMHGAPAVMGLDPLGIHKSTWELAPQGYSAYHAGMDVGATNHPSEILVFGQRAGLQREQLDLLLRVHMRRISMEDQEAIVAELFRFYGGKLRTFGIDKTGLGFTLWERLLKRFGADRFKGYGFSGKYPVALEDRTLERGETIEDLVIERNIVEFATDALREVVDAQGFLLPDDRELILEWQAQTYTVVKSDTGPYGKREYGGGASFHTLDAAKMMIAAKRLATLEALLAAKPERPPVLDAFLA